MVTKQTRTAEEAESARLVKNRKIKETGAATRATAAQAVDTPPTETFMQPRT